MFQDAFFSRMTLGLLVVFSGVCFSAVDNVPPLEQIQLPQCLAGHLSKAYPVLAENQAFKIISIPSAELDELSHLADSVACGRFVNVSHRVLDAQHHVSAARAKQQLQQSLRSKPVVKSSYEIRHSVEVNAAMQQINSDRLWGMITPLVGFQNRSATKATGVAAADWLKETVDKMAVAAGRRDVKTYFVATGRYQQPSLVTVIGQTIAAPAVVIGAHMDTLDGQMPGAGDDASGSATLLEMMHVLLSSPLKLNRPVYVVWYAAEERGLVGSQYVVEDFLQKKIPVHAVVQLDMTGYRSDPLDPTMWVYQDYTNKTLTKFLANLIKTYVKVPVSYSECGYGCSDHASWTAAGFPAAFPCESSFEDHNPFIHTSQDTTSLLNTEHLVNFTKLALAYVIELGLS